MARLSLFQDRQLWVGIWSGRADLNRRPPGPKPGALPLRYAPSIRAQSSVTLAMRLDNRGLKAPLARGGP